MKKQIIVIAYILIGYTNAVFSQEKVEGEESKFNTIFNSEKMTITGFGAPMFSYSNMRGQAQTFSGIQGGFLFNRKIVLGLFGYTSTHLSGSFSGINPLTAVAQSDLYLDYTTGGLYFEYIHKLKSPIHLSFPVKIGMGKTEVFSDKNILKPGDNTTLENSNLFSLEPGIALEFNVAKYFIPGVFVSYRYTILNKDLKNVDDADLSSLAFGIVLKFGKF